jgi:hypothetical protein
MVDDLDHVVAQRFGSRKGVRNLIQRTQVIGRQLTASRRTRSMARERVFIRRRTDREPLAHGRYAG